MHGIGISDIYALVLPFYGVEYTHVTVVQQNKNRDVIIALENMLDINTNVNILFGIKKRTKCYM